MLICLCLTAICTASTAATQLKAPTQSKHWQTCYLPNTDTLNHPAVENGVNVCSQRIVFRLHFHNTENTNPAVTLFIFLLPVKVGS